MNNIGFSSKTQSQKKKTILIISIVAIISIIIFVLLYNLIFNFIFPVLLLGGAFDNPPDQDQVMKLVNDNIDTFNDAIEYIQTLDPDVFGIDYEDKSLHLLNDSHTNPEISNETINKIFDLGVERISIKNKNARFSCGGAGRDYYIGIIYSIDGEPITIQLDDYVNESHISFIKSGDGWEGEGDGNDYYCEKITGNWFFYEMRW